MTSLISMAGKRFGCVIVLNRTGTSGSRDALWAYRCDCGNEHESSGYAIRSGKTKSCPTCSRERVGQASVTHGLTDSPEYRTWTDIQTRCHNPNSTSYQNYGGRGIHVCSGWRESFESFLSSMGARPSKNHSIDRIDNNRGYEPENCRWATMTEQANNKRNNRLATINGETKTAAQWARENDLSVATVWRRLEDGKHGADLIARPWLGSRKNNVTGTITHNGVTDTIAGWSRRTGIKYSTLAMRLTKYKWPSERALSEGVRKCA